VDRHDERPANTTLNVIFFALSDPTRRQLLDHLHARDGQPLSELSDRFSVSRQAVSKHLGILQNAGLIVGRTHGRKTVFSLSPAQIRLIQRAWIDKFVHENMRIDCRFATTKGSPAAAQPHGPRAHTGTNEIDRTAAMPDDLHPRQISRRTTGTDDRSPGSIGQIALCRGMSPEQARRIEATAAALTLHAHVADERSAWLHRS
jgi:DNA-binding transcriptional ArsR family regulator